MRYVRGVSIARKAVRGAAWTIATGMLARLLGVVGTLVLTRFVAPSDYGEVSAATVLVLSANQFATLGLGQYVIAKQGGGPAVGFHATVFHVGLGVVALGAALALGGPLGPFLEAPGMGRFVPGLAVALFLERLSFVPERVLIRDMRFRVVAVSRSTSELVYTAVSVGLAYAGMGAMAIVIGNLARYALVTGLFVASVDRREWLAPTRLRRDIAADMIAFGLPLTLGSFIAVAAMRWDKLLVARLFGTAVMGQYVLAYSLADIPASHIGEQVGDVLLPSFARLLPEKRREALVRSSALLALVIFPLAVGLGAVAPSIVAAFFDARWAGVAPLLSVLSAVSVMRPMGWTIGSYLQARGSTRPLFALEVLKLFVLLGSIAALGAFGPLAACAGVGVGFGVHSLACMAVVRRLDGVPISSVLIGMLGPLVACAPMVGAVLLVRGALGASSPKEHVASLVAEIAAGGVAYCASAFVTASSSARELLRLVRDAARRDRAPRPEVAGAP